MGLRRTPRILIIAECRTPPFFTGLRGVVQIIAEIIATKGLKGPSSKTATDYTAGSAESPTRTIKRRWSALFACLQTYRLQDPPLQRIALLLLRGHRGLADAADAAV